MDANRVIGQIREILDPILKEYDLELVEVTFRMEDGRWVLRITIDHEDGIKVHHCTRVSRELSVHMDVEDFIEVKYYLEVSSPGLDRPLKDEKDYEKYAGKLVAIKAHRSIAGRKKIRGTLEGIEDGIVTVLLEEGDRLEVPFEEIISARLDFKF
jgi:ribosome maturation factor RimP